MRGRRTPGATPFLWLGGLSFLLIAVPLLAFDKPSHRQIPELDQRVHARQGGQTAKQAAALERLAKQRRAKVDFNEVHGSPQWVRAEGGFLSGAGEAPVGNGVPALPRDSAGPIKRFINDNADLFGHDASALAPEATTRQYTNAHNGVRTFAWEQRLDGIAVYESVFAGHVTARGELISVSSTFMPELDVLGATELADRVVLETVPPLLVEEAIGIAAESVEQAMGLISPALSSEGGEGEERTAQRAVPTLQRFRAKEAPGEIEARMVWLPVSRTQMRLCWQIELTRKVGGERHRVLVDVETGEILLRRCLTVFVAGADASGAPSDAPIAADATYRVFTSDSPSPLSPSYATPSTNQPPLVARSLVTLTALSSNASPLGWINPGENQTRGNNVDAHLDRDADDQPDLPRPQGSPYRTFDFPLDLGQDPSLSGEAAVAQLFYWGNFIHDKYYDLGFTEAAGNFQKDNFGRGGAGSDPVLADAQDGSGTDNANFTPTDDGVSPRVQMYLWSGPIPERDGDFDAEVVLHEFTHGLSTRLVGSGVGISALQTAGMGEGWSDFGALTLLSEAGDDVDGAYAFAAYASYQLAGLTQNYYYGIRRYPYTTDMSKNPLTFKDIDPSQAIEHVGVPISPINPFNPLFADEVHAQGEFWCVTLWEARANLIRRYGFGAGNRLMMQLVIDGMKLGPANPTYLEARDAILLADEIDNGGVNLEVLWSAFAKRGLGFSASAPSSGQSFGIVEAFDLPDSLGISPNRPFVASGIVGGPFSPQCFTYALTNGSSNAISWSISGAEGQSSWLSVSRTSGTLPAFTGTNVDLCISSGARDLPAGVLKATLLFSNAATHLVQTRSAELRITAVAQVPFSDGFETGKFADYWVVTGTGPFRTHVTAIGGPHSGNFHVTMDSGGDGIFARNELTLTADLGGYTNASLRFWLKSLGDDPDGPPDQPFIDGADFDGVAVSADGAHWYEAQPLRDTTVSSSYREYVVNLDQAIASFGLGYNSAFRIRFNHYDNNPIPFDGFALDDVSLTGTAVYRYAINAPPRVNEGTGLLAGAGQVTLAQAAKGDVVFQLTSSDPARLTIPSSVLIPAGATSAAFDLSAPDDALLNGSEGVTILASAAGYFGVPRTVFVDDNDIATIKLRAPSRTVEGAGTLASAGSVRLSRKADRDVAVGLSSSDVILAVPATVIVPAGQASASFDITVFDDHILNGSRTVTVTAHVENWTGDSAGITVADNDSPALALQLPARISERDGIVTNLAFVQVSALFPSPLVVSLVSSAPSQLQVPASVTIPAGQGSAAFSLTAIDDNVINGLRTISITASANGFASATASIGLLDDETPPSPYEPSPADAAVNVAVTPMLSWKPGVGEALVNGDFERGDFTAWRLENSTVGSFYVNDGSFDPEGYEYTNAPYDGKFSVVTSQPLTGGSHALYQDVLIPLDCVSARLSWVDKVRNYASLFAPSSQEFRVDIRSTGNIVLANAFTTRPGDPLTNDWTRRFFDVTQFRGQTIRVAFVEQDSYNYFNVALDDISVYLEDPALTRFDIYFGTNSIFTASDLQGTFTNASWAPPALALNTTYYWQIVERRGAATNAGPVWRFTTRKIGSLHHFDWSAIDATQQLAQPFTASLSARDDLDNLLTSVSGPVAISGIAGPATASSILITEIDTGFNDSVEFQNVSGHGVDISNWKIGLYDRTAFTAPRVTVTVPTNTVCPPGAIFQLFRLGTAPGTFPFFFSGVSVGWGNLVSVAPVAVLLRDANDNIVDFVCAYGADPALIQSPFAIPHNQWIGDSVPGNTNGSFTMQRIGRIDHNDKSDWVATAPSLGSQNGGLSAPFLPLQGVMIAPTNVVLVGGVWTGQVAVADVVSNLTLLADDRQTHVGFSSRFNVVADNDLALDLSYSPDLTIPANPIRYVATVRNNGAAMATEVLLTSALASNAQFVSATASQGACSVLNGVLICSLGTIAPGSNAVVVVNETSTAPGQLATTFRVTHREPETYLANNSVTAISTVNLPLIVITDTVANEGNSGTNSMIFTVRLMTVSTLPVSVAFATSNGTATANADYVATSGIVTFPPGSTNQSIIIPILGDTVHEDQETFTVNLSSPTNAAIFRATGIGRINDDDPLPSMTISDVVVAEPSPGAMSNAVFKVSLSAASGLPVFVAFVTSDGTATAGKDYLPQSGVLNFAPGVTNATIVVPVVGDRAAESNEVFYVRLVTPVNVNLTRTVAQCTIMDNGVTELDHFSVAPVPSPQYAGFPFVVSISAKDGRNDPFPNFTGRVSIRGGIPRADVTVGSGSNVWNNPFGTYFHDARTQIIYLANELGGPANLSGLALYVTTPPGQTLSNWTIRLKHTALPAYAQMAWESAGWQTVYHNDENLSASGWVTFPFSTPFRYDGTNNLLVDLSFNNSSYTSDGFARFFPTSTKRTLFFRTDSAFGDPLAWSGAFPPPSATNAAPVVHFLREDAVNLSPISSQNFVGGLSSTFVTVAQPAANMLLRVFDDAGHNGASDLFTVDSSADANGDGLPDAWQTRYFGVNGTGSGPNDDPDHDGASNLQEFRAGTDPLSANSVLKISDVRVINGEVRLQFESVVGRAYRLERAANPSATSWSVIAPFVVGTGGSTLLIDQVPNVSAAFYRIRLLP